jgi:flagellin
VYTAYSEPRLQGELMAIGPVFGVSSYRTINSLNSVNKLLNRTLERLSSGYRINSAADDPAGSAVAMHFSTQVTSGQQAIRNINNGISMVQVAESAMDEVGNILDRMRELAVQSSNGTYSSSQRATIDDEFEELSAEIDRISASTEFNDIQLADGTTSSVSVQVGTGSSSSNQISVSFNDVESGTLGVDTTSVDLSTAAGASSAIDDIDAAIDSVNGYRSDMGSSQNRLDYASSYMSSYVTSMESARSSIMDADLATETADLARLQLQQAAGVAALVQARNINEMLLGLLP